MDFELKDGIDKNGKKWFAIIITIGKYRHEMTFIDEINYDYLKSYKEQRQHREQK